MNSLSSYVPEPDLSFSSTYSPGALIVVPLLYVILVQALKPKCVCVGDGIMKPCMMVYNLFQMVMNLGLITTLTSYLYSMGTMFPDSATDTTHFTNKIAWWGLLFVLFSKYIDLLDTIFMRLRNKDRQVSFLHVYHHASIIFVTGIHLHFGYYDGFSVFPPLLNAYVHLIMYGYYFFTSLGYNVWFKRYITTMQIVQFYADILYLSVGMYFIRHAMWGTEWNLRIFMNSYIITMILLFSAFYRKSYTSKKKEGKTGKKIE